MPQPDAASPVLSGDEELLYRAVYQAQYAFLDAVRAALLQGQAPPLTAGFRPDWNLWPGVQLWRDLLDKHVVPTAARIYAAAAGHGREQDPAATRFARQLVERMAEWPTRVWTAVQATWRQGQARQESDTQLQDRIRSAVGESRWDSSARAAAVTGTTAGTSQALVETARSSGRQLVKTWRIKEPHDQRTRAAHRLADGQSVPLSSTFSVDGEQLDFPGDPAGSPGNVINCRCGVVLHGVTASALEDNLMTDTITEPLAQPADAPTDGTLTAAITADTTLPWAPRDTKWDGAGARQRISAWAEGHPADTAACFVYRVDDKHPSKVSSYKLPVADVIDGKAMLVWSGVTSAAASIQGARGGVKIPANQLAEAKARLASLYMAAAKEFKDSSIEVPWNKKQPPMKAAVDPYELITGQLLAHNAWLTAAALGEDGEWRPRADWFVPHEGGKHGIRITSDGSDARVSGYLATWDGQIGANCHIGMKSTCTPPPRNPDGLYPNFHQDNVVLTLDDGTQLHPGLLTMDIGHGNPNNPQAARVAHYDNPEAMAAAVIAGEDATGIWVAGQVLPEVAADPAKMTRLRLSRFSGHWEPVGQNMQLIAATAVNVPGYQNASATGYRLAASAAPAPAPVVLPAAAVDRFAQLLDWPVADIRAAVLEPCLVDELSALLASARELAEPGYLEDADARSEGFELAGCGCQHEPGQQQPDEGGQEQPDVPEGEEGTEQVVPEPAAAEPEVAADPVPRVLEDLDDELAALVAAVITAEGFADPTDKELSDVQALLDAHPLLAQANSEELSAAANWVERAGGLPDFVKRIAAHLVSKGMTQDHAIATAINAAKKMCASGDTNLPGIQQVNAKSRAEACQASAQWQAMKAKSATKASAAAAA
ncbi:hypothetical protein [Streptacidiphilus cavernicola]|uniref:Phage head morphogenesis domain-containing protein n=1 Tax=Streptacidiphilus cavernicola TaxID=3342716 RepID=A0ABV6VY84_9ACTN